MSKNNKSAIIIGHIIAYGIIVFLVFLVLFGFWFSGYIVGYGKCSIDTYEMILENNLKK